MIQYVTLDTVSSVSYDTYCTVRYRYDGYGIIILLRVVLG